MLGKLRSFSKSKLAGVLIAIIIVPFVFWGMGSVFSGGNTNSLAKINNYNISTKDFLTHLNRSNLTNEIIKEKLKDNILEDQLRDLISKNVINIEIKDLNLSISENSLAEIIKNNKTFQDENGDFSRIKYEKFLLEKNLHPSEYENELKNNELKKQLFDYIAGGVKSPYFKTNKIYNDQYKEINLEYIKLNNFYKQKDSFTEKNVEEYVKKNEEKLKKNAIDFSFVKITPQNLIQSDSFDAEFFNKIDSIENDILNESNIQNISAKYNLDISETKNFTGDSPEEDFFKDIYEMKNKDKIQLIDKNEYYLLYEIENIKKILPNDQKFKNFVKNKLYELNKFNYNKNLLIKIESKIFLVNDFYKLKNDEVKINEILINSVNEETLFTTNSIKLIYSRPNKSFSIINDNNKNIYLAYIKNINFKNLTKGSGEINIFSKFSDFKIKNNLYTSYDNVVNKKYKIEIIQKTLERFKNNFN